jgi:hypothetical protein
MSLFLCYVRFYLSVEVSIFMLLALSTFQLFVEFLGKWCELHHVSQSVRNERLAFHCTDCCGFGYWGIFRKVYRENTSSIKIREE